MTRRNRRKGNWKRFRWRGTKSMRITSRAMNRRLFLQSGAAAMAGPLPWPAIWNSPAGAAKNCILLRLTGGPSQLDTWDMKPEAPSEIRGPFRPIRTNVPGIEISEIFPRMARHADKFALVRSVWHDGPPLHPELASEVTGPESVYLRAEPESLRVRYGLNAFGQKCLRACRLVENGTRFVSVDM